MNRIVSDSLSKIQPNSVFSYPDLDILYKKIANYTDLKPENILITSGSDGAIRACFECCVVTGDKILLTRPTFAMYEVYSKIYGANVTWLDYQSSKNGPFMDVDEVVGTIKRVNPKMICLLNPDSPTGTIFSPDDLKKIIDASQSIGSLMLIDEAIIRCTL